MVITYEDELESELIRIRSAALTDTQIKCASAAQRTAPYPIVSFDAPEVARREYAFEEQRGRLLAREWLAKRGLLDRLPAFEPRAETPQHFGRRLEQFCGYKVGTLVSVYPSGGMTIRPDWFQRWLQHSPSKREREKFACFTNAVAAANDGKFGFRFGFVGNEGYTPDHPKE